MKQDFELDLDACGVDSISGFRIAMMLNMPTMVDRWLLPGAVVMATEEMEQRIVLLRQAPGQPPPQSWV